MADKVLLVEDSEADRLLIRRMLVARGEGWRVLEASTLAEGLRLLEADRPDCVLLDLRLPDGDGREFLRRLGEDNDVAVVMLTGLGDAAVAVETLKLGAQDYVEKDRLSALDLVHCVQGAIRRARFDADLRRRSRELDRVLESVAFALVVLDQQDRVTTWNGAAERLFGVPGSSAVGRTLAELEIGWDAARMAEAVRTCRRDQEMVRVDDLPLRRGDRPAVLGVTANPSEERGVVLLARDVTERKDLERQLAQAQKLEAIGQLASGIAHEINTPTQFVSDNNTFLTESFESVQALLRGCASLAEAAGDERAAAAQELAATAAEANLDFLLEEIPSALSESRAGLERIANIVRAMKAFSHPGSGAREPVDLNAAIRNTIVVARNEWKYVAEVETDLDPDLPPVPCFAGELNQVVLNMIVNGAHAIGDAIDRSAGEKGVLRISTRAAGSHAEVRIADTGTGIPDDVRTRIFDPFFTTKEVGRGTGQGLAIAHAVVCEKHGGTIDLETELGRGTTFVIRLPLTVPAAAEAAA